MTDGRQKLPGLKEIAGAVAPRAADGQRRSSQSVLAAYSAHDCICCFPGNPSNKVRPNIRVPGRPGAFGILKCAEVPPNFLLHPVSYRGVAQPGRAPGSGPGGRRFKSSLPDQSFSMTYMETSPFRSRLTRTSSFLQAHVSDDEFPKRRNQWTPPAPRAQTGVLAKYARVVSSGRGAVTDLKSSFACNQCGKQFQCSTMLSGQGCFSITTLSFWAKVARSKGFCRNRASGPSSSTWSM